MRKGRRQRWRSRFRRIERSHFRRIETRRCRCRRSRFHCRRSRFRRRGRHCNWQRKSSLRCCWCCSWCCCWCRCCWLHDRCCWRGDRAVRGQHTGREAQVVLLHVFDELVPLTTNTQLPAKQKAKAINNKAASKLRAHTKKNQCHT
jgi:hypothetical protein